MVEEKRKQQEATVKLLGKSKNEKMFKVDIPSKGKPDTWFHLNVKVQEFAKSIIEGDSIDIKYVEGDANGAGYINFIKKAGSDDEAEEKSDGAKDKAEDTPGDTPETETKKKTTEPYVDKKQDSIERQKAGDITQEIMKKPEIKFDKGTAGEVFTAIFKVVYENIKG